MLLSLKTNTHSILIGLNYFPSALCFCLSAQQQLRNNPINSQSTSLSAKKAPQLFPMYARVRKENKRNYKKIIHAALIGIWNVQKWVKLDSCGFFVIAGRKVV